MSNNDQAANQTSSSVRNTARLGSRLGFILLSAGCAIGLGNVWKFPYIAGQNGGGVFLITYLIMLVLFGIPVVAVEFSLGRAAQKPPIKMYQALEPAGSKWHLHGIPCMLGCTLLMMFYTVITGWILEYLVKFVKGDFTGLNAEQVSDVFCKMTREPVSMSVALAVVVVLGFGVCAIGLQNGLEKITKYMMAALLLLMLVLTVKSFTMSGSKAGLKFFLYPDFDKAREVGYGRILLAALNQAFFTLSVGIGAMAVFGSYINKDRRLLGESVHITALDTFVALSAGLIMFPACFSYGIDVNSGPSLLFITMPNVFAGMSFGRVWGALFFLFMSFAALSTVFAMFENIIANFIELTALSRRKSCLICGIGMFILAMPCVLGFNIWSGFQPFGEGTNILDLEDFIVSNLLLPIGSIVFILFATLRKGWGWDNFMAEVNAGEGLVFPKRLRLYMKYFVPVVLMAILVIGLVQFFR